MADPLFTFSKQERLCSESRINELFLNGDSFMSYPMRVVWLAFKPSEKAEVKVVMSVPKKKLRHAVDRNRVKRLLRETYRLNKQTLWDQVAIQGLSVHMAFIWIPSEILDYAKVEKKMKDALSKLEQYLPEKAKALEVTENI